MYRTVVAVLLCFCSLLAARCDCGSRAAGQAVEDVGHRLGRAGLLEWGLPNDLGWGYRTGPHRHNLAYEECSRGRVAPNSALVATKRLV